MSKLYLLLLCSLTNAACNKLPGTMICENGVESTIHSSGNVILKHVKVEGDTNVKGQLFVQDSQLVSLDMFGLLKAQNTTFSAPITIWANQAKITGGSTKNIYMTSNSGGQASLVLGGNLTVNGDIRFSDDKGVVIIDNTVQLMGKVTGGVVRKREV